MARKRRNSGKLRPYQADMVNKIFEAARPTRRPRPGMTAPPGSRVPGAPKSPGITPRPGPGANIGRPRPGAARPRPLAKIPTKLAQAGFKAASPSMIAQLQKALANRNPQFSGFTGTGRRPGGAGMGLGAMLGRLDRVPGGMSPGPMGRPTGMRPGGGPQLQDFRLTQAAGIAGRPVNSYAEADRIMAQRGGTGATGGMPPQTGGNPFRQSRKMAEGGEVLKTPIDKLPNKGLKKLAKSPKGRKAVARMGFKDGGIAKGGKCPSRGTIRGTGAAIRGVGFKGIK